MNSSELYRNDLEFMQANAFGSLAGIDEAGRGALAGPVVIAAVVLDYSAEQIALNDSKQLTEKRREELYSELIHAAKAYAIIEIPAIEIDATNIRAATLLGFERAFEKLKGQVEHFLVDGRDLPYRMEGQADAVVKGDARHAAVAAASILAKVYRDRLMRQLHQEYPDYGFATHKGYGTRTHYLALAKHGACPFHRQSFRLF